MRVADCTTVFLTLTSVWSHEHEVEEEETLQWDMLSEGLMTSKWRCDL